MEDKQVVRIIFKEHYKPPEIREIEDKLENWQNLVGGLIECVGMPNAKGVDLFVNEEGKLKGMDGNFWLPEYEDCVVGPCFMVGYNGRTGGMTSLTDKQIKECLEYIKEYEIPDCFDLYSDFQLLNSLMTTKYKNRNKNKVAEM